MLIINENWSCGHDYNLQMETEYYKIFKLSPKLPWCDLRLLTSVVPLSASTSLIRTDVLPIFHSSIWCV